MPRQPVTAPVTGDIVGREAGALTLVEIGLGSVLHGLHVPFSGYFLSLNQGFFLSRAVSQVRGAPGARTLPMQISVVASILKSLSPAGKKLTPMLAISAQGLCYCAGTLLLGANLAGAIVGSALASMWAFVQPLLLYTILYGQTIHEVAGYYLGKFGLWKWLGVLVLAKALISAGLAVAGFRMSAGSFEAYRQKLILGTSAMEAPGAGALPASALRGALRDLTRPLFLASIMLTAVFFYFSENSRAEAGWKLLRPVALGFLFFFAARTRLFRERAGQTLQWLSGRLGGGTGEALERALHMVRRPVGSGQSGSSTPKSTPASTKAGVGPSLPKN